MMKIRNIKLWFLIPILLFLVKCKVDQIGPHEHNSQMPGKVSNVSVKNEPGKATINYKLPEDQDLLYVKAVYTLASGAKREIKSSYYNNFLVADGFAAEQEYEVKLYAVNRSEIESDPVIVKVHPLESPIWKVFRGINALADFGGIKIITENPDKADVAIVIMVDSVGKWLPVSNIYTSADKIDRSLRGMDNKGKRFAITVRDRWLNYTDTLIKELTPLFETPILKSKYSAAIFPGDTPADKTWEGSVGIAKLWDNDTQWWTSVMPTPKDYVGQPYFTFKIDKPTQLSRITIWDYPEQFAPNQLWYYRGNPRHFEIWGSNNPSPDGSWDNWFLLGTFENIKPSGLPYGELTTEDREVAVGGFNYNFKIDVPKAEYIRIKNIENWMGTTWMSLTEVQLYGGE